MPLSSSPNPTRIAPTDFSSRGGLLPSLLTRSLRAAYLYSWFQAQRAIALARMPFFPSVGAVRYFDLSAATNGDGLSHDTPANSIDSLPDAEWVTALFASDTRHVLKASNLGTANVNLQYSHTSTRKNVVWGTYDRHTGERIFTGRRCAELVSVDTLSATNPTYSGRPIIRVDQTAAKGYTVLSGLRFSNPNPNASYDALHVVGCDNNSTIIVEGCSGLEFPPAALNETGYVAGKFISVGGSANVTIRHCSISDTYTDAVWLDRATSGGSITIEWCDFRLDTGKQSLAGPDVVQIVRSGTNIGRVRIANNFFENARDQKAIGIVSGNAAPTSGERVRIAQNICFGADTSVGSPVPPETGSQIGFNIDCSDTTADGNYIEGTALPIKLGARGRARSNVIVRDAAGTVVAGTDWFAGVLVEGANGIVDRNTFIALGSASAGTALTIAAGGTGTVARNNVFLGRWSTSVSNLAGASVTGSYESLGADSTVDAVVDRIGRPVPTSPLLADTPVLDTCVGPDFLGSETTLRVPTYKGAMQVLSTDEPAHVRPQPIEDDGVRIGRDGRLFSASGLNLSDVIGPMTWAELQAAYPNGSPQMAALPAGMRAQVSTFATDFVLNSARTRWRPIGAVTVHSSVTPASTVTTDDNTQRFLRDALIPFRLLEVGGRVECDAAISAALNTVAKVYRAGLINTPNSATGIAGTGNGLTMNSASAGDGTLKHIFTVTSLNPLTVLLQPSANQLANTTGGGSPSLLGFDSDSNPLYFSVNVQLGVGGVSASLNSLFVRYIPPAV